MKKTSSMLLIAGALAMTPSLYAQNGGCSKNLRFSLGYGFPALGQMDTYDETHDKSTDIRTSTLRNVSFGQGIFLEGAFGFMCNENIGFDAALSYQAGTATTLTDKSNDDIVEWTYAGNVFRFTPSIVFTAPAGKVSPYVRVGVPICFSSARITAKGDDVIGGDNLVELETKESFRPTIGFSTALGIRYGLSEKLGLFAEFNMIAQNAIQKKSELVKYTIDGRDALDMVTTRDKITEYETEFVRDKDTNKNEGLPSKAAAERMPFSSAGIRIGIQINL